MKPARRAYIHGEKVDLELLERPIDARFLSLTERERIHDLHRRAISLRAIARQLGRAPSTISRELARNTSPRLGYLPYAAHRAAVARRPRPKPRRLLASGPLRDYVVAGLARRWSPKQISHRLIKEFADEPRMRVATETIYQAIYVQARGAIKKELTATLRRGRLTRNLGASPRGARLASSLPWCRSGNAPPRPRTGQSSDIGKETSSSARSAARRSARLLNARPAT